MIWGVLRLFWFCDLQVATSKRVVGRQTTIISCCNKHRLCSVLFICSMKAFFSKSPSSGTYTESDSIKVLPYSTVEKNALTLTVKKLNREDTGSVDIQAILNKGENATPKLFAIFIQNYANQEYNEKCILMFKY